MNSNKRHLCLPNLQAKFQIHPRPLKVGEPRKN